MPASCAPWPARLAPKNNPPSVISPEKRLAYAAGYLELDMVAAARAELAELPPPVAASPAALTLRIEIAMAEEAWTEVVALAPDLVNHDPTTERPWVAWAYALRELQRIPEAQETLLAGSRLITRPGPLVDYNLACYACLLGDLDDARALLASVFSRDKSWREVARNDPDLAPLYKRPA